MEIGFFQGLQMLLLPVLLGGGVLVLIDIRPRDDALAFAGWSWVAGSLAVALMLFAWMLLGQPLEGFESAVMVVSLATVSLGVFCWRVRVRAPVAVCIRPQGAGWERVAFALTVACCLAVVIHAAALSNMRLTTVGDGALIWAAKAKYLFVTGGLTSAYGDAELLGRSVGHADYPLFNPLLQLWSYLTADKLVHAASRLSIQAFQPALVLVLAAALRRVARPGLAALLLGLMVLTRQMHAATTDVSADHMLALGFLMTLDALERRRETGDGRWWRLALVGLTALVWSKNEGALLLLAVLLAQAVAALLARRTDTIRAATARWKWSACFGLLLPGAVWLTQTLHNRAYDQINDLVASGLLSSGGLGLPELAARLATIGRHLAGALALGGHLILLLCAGLAVCFPRRLLLGHRPALTSAVAIGLAGYIAVYMGTPHDLEWHLETSLDRLLLHLMPVALLWTASALTCLQSDDASPG